MACRARCRPGSASPTGSRSPGTVLPNVAFLILDDGQPELPRCRGGYNIPAIVGMPEMRALGRVRMEQAGRFTVLPPAEGAAGAVQPARQRATSLFADVAVDGRTVPLLLDTGADRTSLTALYAERRCRSGGGAAGRAQPASSSAGGDQAGALRDLAGRAAGAGRADASMLPSPARSSLPCARRPGAATTTARWGASVLRAFDQLHAGLQDDALRARRADRRLITPAANRFRLRWPASNA